MDAPANATSTSPTQTVVTKEDLTARIASVDYIRLHATVTICSIELDNGFSVRGESACAVPANYDQQIGERLAYEDAFRKLWPLFGFLLREKIFTAVKDA